MRAEKLHRLLRQAAAATAEEARQRRPHRQVGGAEANTLKEAKTIK